MMIFKNQYEIPRNLLRAMKIAQLFSAMRIRQRHAWVYAFVSLAAVVITALLIHYVQFKGLSRTLILPSYFVAGLFAIATIRVSASLHFVYDEMSRR